MDRPLTRAARKWEERRKLLASRKPAVRIDRAIIKTASRGEYGYEVVIDGFGLVPAIAPPNITVGGEALEQLTFAIGGRTVTGLLRDRPKGQRICVDLGYTTLEATAVIE
jgi:hypothetical protein